MRKKFLADEYGRGSEFWDANWSAAAIGAPSACNPFVLNLMLEYFPSPGPILEAGCGPGMYVARLQSLGYEVVGVDYGEETVRRLNEARPELKILRADVSALPFADGVFAGCYSGGVVEHFEEGPQRALREARRVLRCGGILLISVPWLNLYRKFQELLHILVARDRFWPSVDLDGRRCMFMRVRRVGVAKPPRGFHFHEYQFSASDMRGFLTNAGFSIIEEHPYSALWGARDMALVRRFQDRACHSESSGEPPPPSSFRKPYWKQLARLVLDDAKGDNLFLRGVQRLVRVLLGNLRIFVCRAN